MSEKIHNPNQHQCPTCEGEGRYQTMVQWSDGPGMAMQECNVCNGRGTIPMSPGQLLDRQAQKSAETFGLLRDLCGALLMWQLTKENTGHYMACEPRLTTMPNPSPWPSTWEPYLDHERYGSVMERACRLTGVRVTGDSLKEGTDANQKEAK